jgi:hypothetical protein
MFGVDLTTYRWYTSVSIFTIQKQTWGRQTNGQTDGRDLQVNITLNKTGSMFAIPDWFLTEAQMLDAYKYKLIF